MTVDIRLPTIGRVHG